VLISDAHGDRLQILRSKKCAFDKLAWAVIYILRILIVMTSCCAGALLSA